MVRRGSTVRVRQRALQKPRTAGLLLLDSLQFFHRLAAPSRRVAFTRENQGARHSPRRRGSRTNTPGRRYGRSVLLARGKTLAGQGSGRAPGELFALAPRHGGAA